jgi:hypothetical protein
MNALTPINSSLSLHKEHKDFTAEKIILLALIDGLLSNVMSSDMLTLSVFHAQAICREKGVDEEVFAEVVKKISDIHIDRKKRNPIGGMF